MFQTVLSVILALVFLAFGAARIRMMPQMAEQARLLGIHLPQFRLVGMLEVLFAVLVLAGIWIEWIGTLGSVLMIGAAAVAIIAHARANSPLSRYVPAIATCFFAVILFLTHVYS